MQRPSSPHNGTLNPIFSALEARYGSGRWIPLEVFIEAALYLPAIGYYRRAAPRVGHGEDRDFYTASSLGTVFTELVVEGICQLLPDEASRYTFVEIGAEPGNHLLSGRDHPFREQRVLRIGEILDLEGPCVVFSNELFDAQPFRRFLRVKSEWQELGLRLGSHPSLEPAPASNLPKDLPERAPEGYQLDYPSGANRLARTLVAQSWHGLFLMFDYGLPWHALAAERPQGTGRTYRKHCLGADLLATPGEHDITHHVCWDHLAEIVEEAGFIHRELISQESFFMRRGSQAIARIIEASPGGFSADRQTLKALLHPENMGRKFQVMHAFRPR